MIDLLMMVTFHSKLLVYQRGKGYELLKFGLKKVTSTTKQNWDFTSTHRATYQPTIVGRCSCSGGILARGSGPTQWKPGGDQLVLGRLRGEWLAFAEGGAGTTLGQG
jgi:hypothetical protein